jgi:hypothetical protein
MAQDVDEAIVEIVTQDLLHAEYYGAKPHEMWAAKSAAWRIVRNIQANGHVIVKQARQVTEPVLKIA